MRKYAPTIVTAVLILIFLYIVSGFYFNSEITRVTNNYTDVSVNTVHDLDESIKVRGSGVTYYEEDNKIIYFTKQKFTDNIASIEILMDSNNTIEQIDLSYVNNEHDIAKQAVFEKRMFDNKQRINNLKLSMFNINQISYSKIKRIVNKTH